MGQIGGLLVISNFLDIPVKCFKKKKQSLFYIGYLSVLDPMLISIILLYIWGV